MRAGIACLLLIAGSGCQDRRDFDARYDATANDLQNRAARIDAEMEAAEAQPPRNEAVR